MKYLNLTTLIAGLWWSAVLFQWATISDPHSSGVSVTLTGAELSQTLTLMPAIVILVALIARYRKIPNQIMFFAAAIAVWASYSAFTLDAAATPAAVSGLELLTGIAGVIGSEEYTFAPVTYSLLAIVVAGLAILAGLSTFSQAGERPGAEDDPSDPRSIWDSQN